MLSRFSRNSLWLLLARIGTQVGLALSTILLARHLGSTVFGEYAFISAIVLIGNTVTTFGTDMHLIREIAATEDDSMLQPALWLQLALSVAFIGAVVLLSGSLSGLSPEAVVATRIYSLSLIPLAFFTVYTTALRARQRMLAYFLLNLALMLAQLTAVLVLIWFRAGLVTLASLLVIVQCFAAVVSGLLSRLRLALIRISPASLHQVLDLTTASAPIALLATLGIVYQRLILLILPSLAGASVTGWYSAAARIVEAAKIGHLAAFTALYPLMAQARNISAAKFNRQFRWPAWILFGAACLAAVALSTLAAPIVRLLFGSDYAASAPLLRIFAWALIPYSLNGLLTLAFLARGRTRPILGGLAASIISLAAITLWLLPFLGSSAAAIAALAAESVQAIILAIHYVRYTSSTSAVPELQYGLVPQAND